MCVEIKTDVFFKGIKLDETQCKSLLKCIDDNTCGKFTFPDGTEYEYTFEWYNNFMDWYSEHVCELEMNSVKSFHYYGLPFTIDFMETLINDYSSKTYGFLKVNDQKVEYTFSDLDELIFVIRELKLNHWSSDVEPEYKCVTTFKYPEKQKIVCQYDKSPFNPDEEICEGTNCDFCPYFCIHKAIKESDKIAEEQRAKVDDLNTPLFESVLNEFLDEYLNNESSSFMKIMSGMPTAKMLYGPSSFSMFNTAT